MGNPTIYTDPKTGARGMIVFFEFNEGDLHDRHSEHVNSGNGDDSLNLALDDIAEEVAAAIENTWSEAHDWADNFIGLEDFHRRARLHQIEESELEPEPVTLYEVYTPDGAVFRHDTIWSYPRERDEARAVARSLNESLYLSAGAEDPNDPLIDRSKLPTKPYTFARSPDLERYGVWVITTEYSQWYHGGHGRNWSSESREDAGDLKRRLQSLASDGEIKVTYEVRLIAA